MKLTNLKPSLSRLVPRIAVSNGKPQEQRITAPPIWRRWYHTKRWAHLRDAVLARDMFTCQMCGRLEGDTSKLVADHKKPHRGQQRLFWDIDNIQTLCADPCHNSLKQREERLEPAGSWDFKDGRSRDASVTGGGAMAHPVWFRRACIPLMVVCGPVAAGKSTYVRAHAGVADLIIDLDHIALHLFKTTAGHLTIDQTLDCLRVRNNMLGKVMRSSASGQWRRAWVIVGEPKAQDRQWWAETTGARIIVINTPAYECRRRAEGDQTKTRPQQAIAAIDKWWADYQPWEGDTTSE